MKGMTSPGWSTAFILQLTVLVTMSCFTLSCAQRWQEPIPPKKADLARIKSVALYSKAPEGDVVYSRGRFIVTPTAAATGTQADLFLIPASVLFFTVEALIDTAKDSQRSERVRKALETMHCEQILEDYFMTHLKQAKVFERIQCEDNVHQASVMPEGYDAIIQLDIKELFLRRTENKALRLYIGVIGRMQQGTKDEPIWEWTETFVSPEAHLLEEYMAEDGKLLLQDIDDALQHIAARLANSIIYARQ